MAYWDPNNKRAQDSMVIDRHSLPWRAESEGPTDAGCPPDGGRPAAECVTLEAEVPELLFRGMRAFLETHPHWDQYSVIRYALAGFLFQHGCQEPGVATHFLDGLFQSPGNPPRME